MRIEHCGLAPGAWRLPHGEVPEPTLTGLVGEMGAK